MDRLGTDDAASPDELGDDHLDLTPRTSAASTPGGTGRSSATWLWGGVLVAIIVGIGFVITQGLTEATLYYRNVDEALASQAQDHGSTFRLQGVVVQGSRAVSGEGVDFRLEYNGQTVDVHHQGAPPELFQDCIPIVVQGTWSAPAQPARFESTEMIVKHDENYEAENSERIAAARAEGMTGDNACVMQAAGIGRS